jgi:hypothetical protein
MRILTAVWPFLTRKSEGFSILSVQVITNPIVIEQSGTTHDCEVIRESPVSREHLTTMSTHAQPELRGGTDSEIARDVR